uniref:BED-type domain-containing protein n=1 Tax=Meloidogyne enterolobii TaxID=390850 RepID=A0A6V7TYC3_MELEN|nr:unnamed protein product [Meloidogyne enterolobii]
MVAKIWKFFNEVKKDGETKRKCLKCGTLLPTPKDFSTSNMINHLKSKNHEDVFKSYKADDMETVPKLTSVWAKKDMETDLQKQLDSRLVRIMVQNNISSYFFDDKDLQEIVKLAFPDQKANQKI